MNKLIGYRMLAFGIDYLIIIFYGMVLLGLMSAIGIRNLSPFEGQIVGFITLTLPVFLYFYLMEKSRFSATIGKRIMRILVVRENSNQSVFLRNMLKFLPWEIAHFGVRWMIYYSSLGETPPVWVWIALILPQLIAIGYFISMVLYKGESSLYDKVANTKINLNKPSIR